jgi:hypothetical protein
MKSHLPPSFFKNEIQSDAILGISENKVNYYFRLGEILSNHHHSVYVMPHQRLEWHC